MRRSSSPVTPALTWKGVAWLLAANLLLLFGFDSLAFYFGRPMMTFGGLIPLILANLVLMVITAALSSRRRLNAGSAVAALAIVTFGTVWLVGHNSGHNALPGLAPGQRDGCARRPDAGQQHRSRSLMCGD
ncbi:hypothetical protein EAS64_12905 [Trebonia kvetii]|uniref:Uncharacterized protein n=1 Tax=Trebonia kvetii TaxID=2480626 RepID=A0A6P2C209_9ACTN|nr:hypothetical protein [Trebonia kvetii]TVZ05442.1 hypothetical protein EAS64_12905 [Trebonia kvetii]